MKLIFRISELIVKSIFKNSYFKISGILILLLGLNIQGQSQVISVKGKVIDAQGQPVVYSIVEAREMPDSVLVEGLATDQFGTFFLKLPKSTYLLSVSMIGSETYFYNIDPEMSDLDLGKITLKEKYIELDGVTIQGRKNTFDLSLDKRVFNVGQDLSNSGANATEILENIPSVTVDGEGNVSLRGNQSVRILINGRPSGLVKDSESLQNLQGSMIEKVEIVTNASAKYEAEGDAGIINIILKNEKKTGINGSVVVNGGYFPALGIGLNLNYRTPNVNYFLNSSHNFRDQPGTADTYQSFNGQDTSFIYNQTYSQARKRLSNNTMVGAEWQVNEFNMISASGLFDLGDSRNLMDRIYANQDDAGNLTSKYVRTEEQKETDRNYEAVLTHHKTFDQPDRTWTTRASWNSEYEIEASDYNEFEALTQSASSPEESSVITEETNYIIQSDYVHPFNQFAKIETGLRYSNRNIINDFAYGLFRNDAWQYPEQYNDTYKYIEYIHAAYVNGAKQFNKIALQGGIRAEYSDINTLSLENSNNNGNKSYLSLFPSASFSYNMENKNTLQFSYSRRIRRPGQWDLLPFSKFGDNREFRIGNPYLDPEFTNSYETGYLKNWEKGSLLSSIYYRHKTGVIERITTVTEEGIVLMTPQNLSTEDSYGLELNYNQELGKIIRINSGLNFFRSVTNGQFEGQSLYADAFSWSNRTSVNASLRKWRSQVAFNYQAPRNNTQGRSLAVYHMDFALSRELFKNKLFLVFNVRDVFNSRKWRSIRQTDEIYTVTEMQWRPRSFNLSITYRINQVNDQKKDLLREERDDS